ncbi:MAG: glycosyltransferase family 2 protein, partial [Anaerolineaceae bacterium]|nr:glycosyltransferase family 2 protein [Anaerolineaceae bacterium]
MHSNPLVSIITPSYNQADYLEQTMLSVLEQDYARIEYWVIDGGSDDGSQEIIQSYADRLAGWVSEKDSGQAHGVNKGFAKATGEIIGWLNSDDLYYPGAIRAAVEAFKQHPQASFVFSDVESIDENGQAFHLMRYGDWKLPELMSFHIIGQPGVFLRREVLEQAGYLDLSYNYLLDVQLWIRMAAIAEPFYVPGAVW